MSTLLKNFIRPVAFVGLLFAVACTQDAIEDLVSEDTQASIEELVAGTGAGGSDDSTRPDTGRLGHCWKGGRGNHPGKIKGDSIGFADLPAAAQTYLIGNTDTTTISRIVKITLPDSTVRYVVRFTTRKHIHFDANGAVVTPPANAFVEITFADLPAAAQTYLNANVTVANITTIIKITKPDGTVEYGVRLNDNTRYTFNAAGARIENPKKGRGRRG